MCPESAASPSTSASMLLRCGFLVQGLEAVCFDDEPVPVVVPYCDEDSFVDDLISMMPMTSKGVRKVRSPPTKHTIVCAAFVNSPPSPTDEGLPSSLLSPLSSPDSGFSSDDTLTSPTTLTPTHQKQIRQKRSVRFADAMGLQLERVKYYTRDEELLFDYESRTVPPFRLGGPLRPLVPQCMSASSSSSSSPSTAAAPSATTTVADRPLPHQLHPINFVYRTHNECAARTRDTRITVSSIRPTSPTVVVGQVYVLNIAPEKKVMVRYSLDGWSTHAEVAACWSSGGFPAPDLDIFNFRIAVPAEAKDARRCELCVAYSVEGATHWDNNEGSNYVLEWKQQQQADAARSPPVQCAPSPVLLPPSASKFAAARLRLYSFDDDDDLIPPVHPRQARADRDAYRCPLPTRPSRLHGFSWS